MYNQQSSHVLPPIPPLSTPIYSGRLQIGTLNQQTKVITLFHSPYPYRVLSTRPGAYVLDHFGKHIGRLGYNGQLHRFR
ncbi:MAG: hypothetical protein ACFE0Q_01595 [Anaerolineae bacterium]